jgi:hypothetical protein
MTDYMCRIVAKDQRERALTIAAKNPLQAAENIAHGLDGDYETLEIYEGGTRVLTWKRPRSIAELEEQANGRASDRRVP